MYILGFSLETYGFKPYTYMYDVKENTLKSILVSKSGLFLVKLVDADDFISTQPRGINKRYKPVFGERKNLPAS